MSQQDKNQIHDVAILTYKGYTQMAISIELNLPLEHVRGVQKYLADGGEFLGKINGSHSTINRIKQIERKLFKMIEVFLETGSKDLVLLRNINELKYEYANALV